MNRETVYAAHFAKVSTAANFVTINRKLRHWNDVSPAEQPALFQSRKDEAVSYPVLGAPGVWMFRVELHLYAHSSDPYKSGEEVLNPLLDAVLDSLKPPAFGPGGRMTQDLGLPDIVQHCRVSGPIETDEGKLGDQAVAIVTVEILCVE